MPLAVAGIPLQAHTFRKEDIRSSLIPAHDICSQKHSILLEETGATIIDPSGRPILHVPKQSHSRLWSLPIMDSHHQPLKQSLTPPDCTVANMNSIVPNSTHAEKTAYASASMGSPTNAALLAAFSKSYIDMHGITPKIIRQNPPRWRDSTGTQKRYQVNKTVSTGTRPGCAFGLFSDFCGFSDVHTLFQWNKKSPNGPYEPI